MEQNRGNEYSILLGVCFLAQTLIGTSQPFGLSAGILIPVLAGCTAAQLMLFKLLTQKKSRLSRSGESAALLVLCLSVGYDVVKAERFYHAVTAAEFSFWWLVACMLLIGWYAARCARPAVLRTAQPVLILLFLSLLALGLTGSYRLENLVPARWERTMLFPVLRIAAEQIFCPEALLWLLWRTDRDTDDPAIGERQNGSCIPYAAILLHTAVLAAFALLGEMALGQRFARLPQIFGTLSLLSAGADANHGGSLYHCVWLIALAVRIGAECEMLGRMSARLMPRQSRKTRLIAEGSILLLAALLWEVLWRENCLLLLSCCVGAALLLCMLPKKKNMLQRQEKEVP